MSDESLPERPERAAVDSSTTTPDERTHDTAEIVRRLPAPIERRPAPQREVTVVDLPVYRLRRPGDLLAAILAVLGIALVLLFAVFAHATTEGVTEDVQAAIPAALRNVILAPVNLIEGITTLMLPLIICIERLIRRQPRLVGEAVVSAIIGTAITIGGVLLINALAPNAVLDGVVANTSPRTSFVPIVAGLAAFLTVVGATDRRRLVSWTWNLLWLTLALQVLSSGMSLPGALASVLAGRAVGQVVRYITGVLGDRAYGSSLIRALRRSGIDPVRVLRIVDGRPLEGVAPVTLVTDAPIGYVTEYDGEPLATAGTSTLVADPELAAGAEPATAAVETAGPIEAAPAEMPPVYPVGSPTAAQGASASSVTSTWEVPLDLRGTATEPAAAPEPAESTSSRPALRTTTAVIGEQESENRIYSVRDAEGRVWDVGVLDGDRQVVGTLAAFWSTIRFKELQQRTIVSLRAAAERASLMTYAAEAAGVRTPTLRGIADEQDSAVLVSEHVPGTESFENVQTRRLTDDVLDRIWQEVRKAHAAGLAHRSLDTHSILLDADNKVWLTGWSSGEIASGSLMRRLDLAHVLALLALRLGAERAMASATRNLTSAQLTSIAPILQPVALPVHTRAEARRNKAVLKEVQELLVGVIPTAAEVAPMQLRRFSARTVITLTVAVVAGWIVLTTVNFTQIVDSVREANPWLLVAAFVLGLSTYVGSAMGLVAFSPVKISLWRTTMVQVAASVVALVTPAGVGPAALNLRYLQKSKLDTPMALATVALVQVSQFVTTILLLLAVALATGSSGALDQLPSTAVLIAVLGVVALIGSTLFFPKIRHWVLSKIMPTLRQVWPRLVWVVGQPGRLAMGIGGNLIMTVGYVAAFGLTLLAFGESIPLTSLAIIYLAGNAAGSAIPTPGGVGTVDVALAAGLRTASVAAGTALSVALIFRVLTFWGRVPLGWLALRSLQKRNLV